MIGVTLYLQSHTKSTVIKNRNYTCFFWFNYGFSFTLAYSRISHGYSSLFIIVINLIFMFSL